MKDIKSSLGGGTYPLADDSPGTLKGVSVRNLGPYGRRVGIFTNGPELVVGAKIHAADYRHTPEDALEIPDGYQSGKTVELSGARNYHKIFTFNAPAPFHVLSKKQLAGNTRLASAVARGVAKATAYDPAFAVTDFLTGDMSTDKELIARNYVSMTLEIGNQNYNFTLDVNKHPAVLTADLNHQIAQINHNLRAYVSVEKIAETELSTMATWSIHLAVPTTATVKVPVTDYKVETFSDTPESTTGLGAFQPIHLNNSLVNGLEIKRLTMTPYVMSPLVDPKFATAKTVEQLIAGMKTWGFDYPDSATWKKTHILLDTDFAVMKQDTRFNIVLIEVSPQYKNGDLHQLKSVNYLSGGIATPADLLVIPRDSGDGVYGSRLIDIDASLVAGRFVAPVERANTHRDLSQYLPEHGSHNGGGDTPAIYASRIAIALIAPSTGVVSFTPLYRPASNMVNVEMHYDRNHITQSILALDKTEYEWSKEADARVPVVITLDTPPNTAVDKVIASHATGTIEELTPTVTEVNGKWTVELTDGFSQRDLTYTRQEGTINLGLFLTRDAPNNTAQTKLKWDQAIPYTVKLPDVAVQVVFEAVPRFFLDLENNDPVVFNGSINLPPDALEGLRNPLYYSSDADFRADVNGEIDAVSSGTFVKPTNFGLDAPGLFTYSIPKSTLSDFGVGTHTLNVEVTLHLLWNTTVVVKGSVTFQIIPLIEGTEDDVTFFTPTIFNANTEREVLTNLQAVDLDSGEILASSTSLQGLIEDAATRGEIEVGMIYGKPPKAPITCDGALNEVTLEIGGQWRLEVDGLTVGVGTMETLAGPASNHDIKISMDQL